MTYYDDAMPWMQDGPVWKERAETAERDLATAQARIATLEGNFRMYREAWIRELGNKLIHKSHEIDALVLTTRWVRERADKWIAHENGVLGKDPFHMVPAGAALAEPQSGNQ